MAFIEKICVEILSFTPVNPASGTPTAFIAEVSPSSTGGLVSVEVDFGDGSGWIPATYVSGTQWTVNHTYAVPTPIVTVTIRTLDTYGNYEYFTRDIIVT